MAYPLSVLAPLAPLTRSLTALALCAAPLLAQAQNCPTGINTDDNYILGDIGGTASTMHWATGLVWKRCLEGQSFDDITNQCAGGGTLKDWNDWAETDGLLPQSFTGQNSWGINNLGSTHNLLQSGAWRMAYQTELLKITESCGDNPKLNRVVFPNAPVSYVWSGSPDASNTNLAWNVGFYNGYSSNDDRNDDRHVRLVRAGQSFTNLISPAAQTVVANAQASFAPITLAPSTGTGQAWGGVRIIGAGNPQFQVNGGGWVKEAIVKSGDTLTVHLTAPAAGSHTATLELRSGQTTGSADVATLGDEATAMQKTTASFTLTALGGAQPIPTLGEWAVLLLTGLLGLLGAGALRRRNSNENHQ